MFTSRGFLKKFSRDPAAMTGAALVLIILLGGLFAPLLAPHDPFAQALEQKYTPPFDPRFRLGSDGLGQDVLSRVLYGARISLVLGALVCLLSSAIGVTLGCLAGYCGGWLDLLLMRLTDIVLAFPFLILAIAMMSIFERPSLLLVFLVLGAVGWADVSRLVRAQVLVVRELDFVSAARALGQRESRIVLFHVLPNCIAPVIIWFSLRMAQVIMAESSLSFLGLGAEPGQPSWGNMLFEGFRVFRDFYWVALFPGIALALTVFGFNLLGDGLQDALNPKLDD